MFTAIKSVVRVSLFALPVLIGTAVATPTTQPQTLTMAAAKSGYPEVRLRKMHMVRPDLIPFPMDIEIFC